MRVGNNSPIRKSASSKGCKLLLGNCSGIDTVVFCHLNNLIAGKGMGKKASDLFGVYGCFNCHNKLDKNQVDDSDILRAMIQTQYELLELGLIKIN